jgi:hypothetical protein
VVVLTLGVVLVLSSAGSGIAMFVGEGIYKPSCVLLIGKKKKSHALPKVHDSPTLTRDIIMYLAYLLIFPVEI